MKKIVIALAIVFVTGIVAISTWIGNIKPAVNDMKVTFYNYQKELASGD